MKFARISTLKIPLYYQKFDNKEVFIVKFISCNFVLCLMTQPLLKSFSYAHIYPSEARKTSSLLLREKGDHGSGG